MGRVDAQPDRSRRQVIAGAAIITAALAGCGGPEPDPDGSGNGAASESPRGAFKP